VTTFEVAGESGLFGKPGCLLTIGVCCRLQEILD